MMAARPKILKKGGKQSEGKGFSPDELKKAGLSLKEAVKLHIPVDPRRKTAHEENIKAVRTFLEHRKTAVKTKKRKGKSKS
jgi:ribosomal protein L13E